jgi:hypothetical protein
MAHADFKTRRWRPIETGFPQPGDPIELVGGQLVVAQPQESRPFAAVQAMACITRCPHPRLRGASVSTFDAIPSWAH